MLPPRTVVRRSPAEDGPAVPSSATAAALATRADGARAPGSAAASGPMVFGAPAGTPHVVRRFVPSLEGAPPMSIDGSAGGNRYVDKTDVEPLDVLGFPEGQDALLTSTEFRDAVIRIVEQRLEEETERRAWRRGTEVF